MAHALYYTDLDVVTAHLELDYKVPVHVGERIECEAQVTEFGTGRSIRAQGTIKRDVLLFDVITLFFPGRELQVEFMIN